MVRPYVVMVSPGTNGGIRVRFHNSFLCWLYVMKVNSLRLTH